MSKYYFLDEDAEYCYNKNYLLRYMEDNNLTELEVYNAKIEKIDDYFFCKGYGEVTEKGNCGKGCKFYNPKNQKNGCCKHYDNLYTATDKILIKRKAVKE